MPETLDIAANRSAKKYGRKEMLLRVLWMFGGMVFRLSPRPCHRWRCFLLRCFGARIDRDVQIHNTAKVVMPWNLSVGQWSAIGEHALIYNLGKVRVGKQTTISQRTHLCAGTHDATSLSMPLLKLPIVVGDQVWICADAFIGPGVTIGDGAIAAARAVVVKDVSPWEIVAGNPARRVKDRVLNDTTNESDTP